MPHWKLTLAYDGTDFQGWQVQPGRPTIQGLLAAAIEEITGERVLPQGSGRTDSGVHALAQVAHVSLETAIPAENLLRALNRGLTAAVRVLSVEEAPAGFHARYSALRKTYEYRIFPRRGALEAVCSPFLARFVWECPWRIDLDAARAAAACVMGEHDFTSFAAVDPEVREGQRARQDARLGAEPASAVRTIYESAWREEDGLYLYRVTGSGFLHHMVRNLVGTFVDVGAGRLSPEDLPKILSAKRRSAAGPTAPARGLFLLAVEYPEASV